MNKITSETILSCGHAPTVSEPGTALAPVGTGYATWGPTGETLCYACADARERQAIADGADRFGAYVSETGRTLTTWTGGTLATVTALWKGPRRWSDRQGDWRMEYVRAVTPDGREWYGAHNADWQCVTMRARKS
jgi:hypothetical protein